MESPDLSDPDVRELLDRNHKPEEITVRRLGDTLAPLLISCEQCGEPYPCPTRVALREDERKRREWKQENLRRSRQQAMRANPRRNCGDPGPHPEHSYTGFAAVFYCPGIDEPVDTSWVEDAGARTLDCEDVHRSPHRPHPWRATHPYGEQRWWCPGG